MCGITTNAVILAGGDGTRMAADGIPGQKTLLEVAGKPLLQWVVEFAARAAAAVTVVGDYEADRVGNLAKSLGVRSLTCKLATPEEMVIAAVEAQSEPTALILSGDTLVPTGCLCELLARDPKASCVGFAKQVQATDSHWVVDETEAFRPRILPSSAPSGLERIGWVIDRVQFLEALARYRALDRTSQQEPAMGVEPGSVNRLIDGLSTLGVPTEVRWFEAQVVNVNRSHDLERAETFLASRGEGRGAPWQLRGWPA